MKSLIALATTLVSTFSMTIDETDAVECDWENDFQACCELEPDDDFCKEWDECLSEFDEEECLALFEA